MNIEFKEIELLSGDVYNSLKYPNTGFFLVDQKDLIAPASEMIVYNAGNMVYFMLNFQEIRNFDVPKIKEEPKLEMEGDTNSNGSVSEELFLKAMSLMVNKDESYKQ
jgi:hypothetical protein